MAKPFRLPIDTGDVRLLGSEPTPVRDREGKQRKNADDVYLWQVEVHTFGGSAGAGQVWPVQVAADAPPRGISDGTDVRVRGLVVTEWEHGDRHGLIFRADSIEPANGKAAAFSGPAKQDGQG
jgi:hypothetical protein